MFKKFSTAVFAQYNEMAKGELFTVLVEDIFAKYLAAFPLGSDPIRRVRTEHDCNCCKGFVRRLGTVVSIKDNKIITVWDVDVPSPFKEVAAAMAKLVRKSKITGVFRAKERSYGKDHNYGPDETLYEHFHGAVHQGHFSETPEAEIGKKNGLFQVLNRGLTELREQDFEVVLDLINNNQLYKGGENKTRVESFQQLMKDFKAAGSKPAFAWANLGHWNAGFRNDAIGTLFVDLAKGDDLDVAVRAFEKKVAPENYQRTTSVITQRMVEDAVQTLTKEGLHGALQRRFATMRDVSVNDVLFVSNDARALLKDGIAKLLAGSVKTPAPDLKRATPITADAFVEDILPGATSLALFLENRHAGNFVSLTGGDGDERLFKWDNNFAWSYDGDTTDSVKQRVKAAGGNINALLRVSLSWTNTDDLDLHCEAPWPGPRGVPTRRHIYFSDKAGILDVDMNAGTLVRNPVENLAFDRLYDGVYQVFVHQFRRRETTDYGFAIEVEFGGLVQRYSYDKAMRDKESVPCFALMVDKGVLVETKVGEALTGGSVAKEKWGVKTESLVPVAAVMYSPNHWGDQKVGARHTIFALEGCKNPEPVRGVYNEYLRGDLIKHRKVFEVLGAKTKCQPTDDQISGVGFSAARGDTVTIVVDGKRSFTLSF